MYTTRDVVLATISTSGGFDSVHGLVLTLFLAQYEVQPWVERGRLVRLVREYYYGGRPLVAGDWYIWDGLPWSNEVDEAVDGLADEGLVIIEHQGPWASPIRPSGMANPPGLPGLVMSRIANALGRYASYTPWGLRNLVRWLLGLGDYDKALYYNGLGINEYLRLVGAIVEVVTLG